MEFAGEERQGLYCITLSLADFLESTCSSYLAKSTRA